MEVRFEECGGLVRGDSVHERYPALPVRFEECEDLVHERYPAVHVRPHLWRVIEYSSCRAWLQHLWQGKYWQTLELML